MPRDEPVSSLRRLALKPTEFREKVGLIGFPVLHDVPPCIDDSGSDQLPCKEVPNRGTEEYHSKALLGVSASALAADGPAEGVAKGASGILRPRQCRSGNFGVRRRQ